MANGGGAKGSAIKPAHPPPAPRPLLLSGARPPVTSSRARSVADAGATDAGAAPSPAAPVASPTNADPVRAIVVTERARPSVWSYPGLSQRDLYLIAADAFVSPRTVVRYLRGMRTQSGTRDGIEAALRKHNREHLIVVIVVVPALSKDER